MSLITASDLAKSIGPDDIFAGVTLTVPPRARIGLVGPNGVGKTTLLRVLAGLDESTGGQIHRAKDLQIGYLPQEADLNAAHTLLEACLRAFADLRALEEKLSGLEAEMADPAQAEVALARYGPLQERFERQGGYTYRVQIEQVLTGLGFSEADRDRPLSQLSGGQRTRALLARLLLSSSDLLLLDEPTNHLDIAAVEWLESYLKDWGGGAVIVSHDRYFLDRVVGVVWEMGPLGFETYRGNYSAYVEQREGRWERRRQIFVMEVSRLEKELDYIRRNIAGQRTMQAKGKLRRLSRQLEAIEQLGVSAIQGKSWSEIAAEVDTATSPMGVEEAGRRLSALKTPSDRPISLKLKLKSGGRSGDLVLRTRSLAVGYPDAKEPLFETPDLVLRRGECAAVIGPNGAGKTTFLKTLLGQVPPRAGEVILGASLEVGYFAQAHSELDPENTLIEEVQLISPNMLVPEVRSYLARFQFTGEDVFKSVAVLSGGERGRLALAKLALTDANLLLLDEPTNHLDIPSQEVLQTVLAEYDGTVLLVSHDRYLIDALADQVWEIDADEAALQAFRGTYSEYRAQKESQREIEAAKADFREPTRQPPRTKRRRSHAAWDERRRKTRLREVEAEITRLEKEIDVLGQALADPPEDPGKVVELGNQYVQLKESLDELLERWAQLHEDGPN
jgi:ATP-binding cassette subfamily F protein 3